ncbi:MAG TPA: hypothetical protein VL651_10925 [Bacteroidia bacterium]|jgi:hypothetical protein|nr:hypothetical protein [Bacteroidia bacterium]
MRKIVLAVLIVPSMISCGGKPEMPADFSFVLTRMDIDSYSSSDSTYKYKNGTDTTTTLVFTEQENKKVFQALLSNDFWNIPEHDEKGPRVSDALGTTLEVHSDGKTKKIDVSYACNHDADLLRRFCNVITLIDSIIRTKPAYNGISGHS